MRILHSSDWHLGKHLGTASRINEQREFVDEIIGITESRQVDMVIISGDIYDSFNPSAEAEQLFYNAVSRLSDYGKRPVLIIAGNHDSPERLTASSPLAEALGVILIGTLKTVPPVADYKNFKVTNSGEGFVELFINGETAVVITMPYPSEKRLNEILSEDLDEVSAQKSYSEKISALFHGLSEKYKPSSINIAAGHFYITGGEITNSERDIQLGGAYAVDTAALPPGAQYVAMGHLHRAQSVSGNGGITYAYYSGSPIQYSKSEAVHAKSVYLADIQPGGEAIVDKIYLRNYKPIEIWKVESIEAAILMCNNRKNDNSWVFLEIKTDRPLMSGEIRQMHLAKKDIVEIRPVLLCSDDSGFSDDERSLVQEFEDYYNEKKGAAPSKELLALFAELSADIPERGMIQ